MLPDRVSNAGSLTYESGALPSSAQLSMKFFLLINVKMPTTVVVGILTFISRKNSILGLSEYKFFDILILMSI